MPQPSDPVPSGTQSGATSLTLLQRLRSNDSDAWRVMVDLYTPLVQGWCANYGLRGPDVEDLSQEVFRSAAAHLDQFRRDRPGDTFRGWLHVITRNAAAMHFRRAGKQPRAPGGTEAFVRIGELPDPADPGTADDAEERSVLNRRALEMVRSEFEARTWEMFWQTVVDGRSPVELAAELGVTPAAVRKAKSRVLHRLKERFADLLL